MEMTAITIHPELQTLIPPLTPEEYAQLEANLVTHGCLEPLIIWDEQQTLLDGHNRYAICQKRNMPHATRAISLPSLDAAKAWMLSHQLGRRNLTPEQMSYLRGKQGEQEKTTARGGGDRRSEAAENHKDHFDPYETVDKKLAKEHKVSAPTIKRDMAYARHVDIVSKAVPNAKQSILSRDTKVGRQEVKKLATIAEASPQAAKHVLEDVKKAETPKAAKAIIDKAAKQVPVAPKPESKPKPVPLLSLLPQELERKHGLETIKASDGRDMFILHNPESKSTFNHTNEMVDWASWTWNPVTGCWHGCDYCYAREIANDARMANAYPKQFEPMFHPARLEAPANTKCPQDMTRPQDKNVFTCSMADLFGKWVPDDWIMRVFERVTLHPEWNFLFLTKFPQRLQEICDNLGGFPANAWVGCTVDAQARVATAERSFRDIRASVRWLSVEPMRERLTFNSLEMFDWVVIGGQTQSYFNNTPAFQPEWEWVEHLWQQARAAQVKIYWKENLTIRPKEVPWS